mmetsp:Transcript_31546/g.61985  ORF Transcript_31546/g.61985 Transcript_31546/m.61985 type:complete len:216 (+) Transcript_31546:63-710(+)|eukprot:CAMPEP_0172742516 /NCGR_PEP_ID=MMETSP1074-20121228/129716_1 /TAXON_ID=2916 /ORGANISM="Ceratium fusus, Strain PA161109" /LENGTH=215 /DNA_ID=CAMNT_0013573077 /DNA_START=60 /DNA_END=707 /DNA_ORIENTATION=-
MSIVSLLWCVLAATVALSSFSAATRLESDTPDSKDEKLLAALAERVAKQMKASDEQFDKRLKQQEALTKALVEAFAKKTMAVVSEKLSKLDKLVAHLTKLTMLNDVANQVALDEKLQSLATKKYVDDSIGTVRSEVRAYEGYLVFSKELQKKANVDELEQKQKMLQLQNDELKKQLDEKAGMHFVLQAVGQLSSQVGADLESGLDEVYKQLREMQ